MVVRRVCVLGAGASGLTAIKSCLDEGLEPVCFEKSDYIAGLWHFTPNVEEGQSCVMKNTIINTSKEMMCFSDFPIPKEFAVCMHNKYVEKYFHLYADHFKLKNHIQLKTEVVSVKRSKDYKSTGKWDITYRKVGSKETTTETFDAVLVCTGHHAEKKMATWPGLDKFKGKVIHTHDYKDFHGYEDKRVIVVGTGNSGMDVTLELSRHASQVYLSTRRGAWIISRVEHGKPFDMLLSTRANTLYTSLFPKRAAAAWRKDIQDKFDHEKYGMMPEHDVFAQHPSVGDDLPNRVIAGSVKVKGDIREISENSVIFEDGSKLDDIDAIILATGYIFGFPFVEKEVIDVKENKVELFKRMFAPDLEQQTIAFIGCFQPVGALFPISESQCRLATRVFKGDVKLPTKDDMWADVRYRQDLLSKRYVKSTRHTIQVDYVPFLDELAELNGHKPNLVKLFFTDPVLWKEVFFGPCSPYQYRLHGPGAWPKAREMIMSQWDRTFYPLSERECKNTMMSKDSGFGVVYMAVVAIMAVLLYCVFK